MPLRAPRQGESSYRLLTQLLREQIFRDEFDEVRPLPTELALAEEHQLSRQTVRRAFQELVAEGLVYRVQGRGTFVTPRETRYRRPFGTVDDLLNLQVDTDFELVEPLSVAIDRGAATTLLQAGPQVHSLTFLRRHHGEAFCLTHVYLPPKIAQSLAGCRELTDPGIHTTATVIGLIESHGNDIAEAEQVITATAADDELAGGLVDLGLLGILAFGGVGADQPDAQPADHRRDGRRFSFGKDFAFDGVERRPAAAGAADEGEGSSEQTAAKESGTGHGDPQG